MIWIINRSNLLFGGNVITPILEKFLEDFEYEDLPEFWHELDTKSFSPTISLYDFQEDAIKNIIKTLYLYYKKDEISKDNFFQRYASNGLDDKIKQNLDIKTKNIKKDMVENMKIYFSENNGIIEFFNFVNRLAIWMATGSGKTLVMIKLLEILCKLMKEKEIPEKDVLIMAPREDLLNQIQNHIVEFNKSSVSRGFRINLKSLSEYETTKMISLSSFVNEFNIFYYKSDLISDEQKTIQIDFKNYENNGNWYVILDEAHKGDKEDSKRQSYYSIFARNGFLFNFSAVFVELIDIITTAFNFNLEKFITKGFGKHISIQTHEVTAFKDDFSSEEKQKIVLKSLLLLTYIKKQKRKLDSIKNRTYHEPLLVTLVNSVNLTELKEESDLKLFFNELEKIAKGNVKAIVFKSVLDEMIQEFNEKLSLFYEDDGYNIDINEIKKITVKDILKEIFNSDTHGEIEVKVIPGTKKEAIFKLKTTEKYFAMIKIGEAITWVKQNLKGYEIVETFDDRSVFERLDEKNEISILMGSRAFYEGWDSNRPNIILFINIGVGNEAKRFVTQSIGRGVRIEPLPHKRRRLLKLYNAEEDDGLFEKLHNFINELETVFVFGTKKSVIEQIIGELKEDKKHEKILDIIKNEHIVDPLLIQCFKEAENKLFNDIDPQKFIITENQYNNLKLYLEQVDDKILIARHDITPDTLEFFDKSFKKSNIYFKIDESPNIEFNSLLNNVVKHFNIRPFDFDKFKKIDDEIKHYKMITVSLKNEVEVKELTKKIKSIQKYKDSSKEEAELTNLFKSGKISLSEFTEKIKESAKMTREESFKDLRIKNVANHFYIPMITSVNEKLDYIKHIITNPSELEFLQELDNYEQTGKIHVDSWTFSRIDEHTDDIHIPYYDPRINHLRKFKPDFIFWLKKDNQYKLVFVDPKGIGHTDYAYKIDWFKRIFGENNKEVKKYELYEIRTSLYLYTHDKNLVGEEYKKYWKDKVDEIFSFDFPIAS